MMTDEEVAAEESGREEDRARQRDYPAMEERVRRLNREQERETREQEHDEKLETLYGNKEPEAEEPGERNEGGPEHEPPAPQAVPTGEESFSVRELQTLSQVNAEQKQLRSDEKRVADTEKAIQAHGGDLVKACGGDREKAAAVRSDLADLKKSVEHRQRGERVFAQQWGQHRHAKKFTAEHSGMVQAEPKLNDPAYRTRVADFGREAGLTNAELSNITANQAVALSRMMEKSEAGKPKPKGVIPKHARRPSRPKTYAGDQGWKPGEPVSKLKAIAQQRVRSGNATANERAAAVGEVPPAVSVYGLSARKASRQQRERSNDDPVTILYGGTDGH